MKSLVINIFFYYLLAGTLNAEDIEYKLYLKDNCKLTVEQIMFYVIKIDGKSFHPNENTGITELPDTGRYELFIVEQQEPIEIIIKDYMPVVDTISLPMIEFKSETSSKPMLHGFYCCDTLCNGKYVDYYINGNKRMEGKFRKGRAIGEIRYYNRQGALTVGRYYNKYGKVKKTKRYY